MRRHCVLTLETTNLCREGAGFQGVVGMRRFALLFALACGVTFLAGCNGWNYNDPFHPVVGVGCPCPPKPCKKFEPCDCGEGIINPYRTGHQGY